LEFIIRRVIKKQLNIIVKIHFVFWKHSYRVNVCIDKNNQILS